MNTVIPSAPTLTNATTVGTVNSSLFLPAEPIVLGHVLGHVLDVKSVSYLLHQLQNSNPSWR
ncbi:hypothetical protein EON65_58100 [archaeon]|nr:MAG: hypothetical protein EON65_58100 [archaeon]